MMARIATTTQKKNTTMPGMAYPAIALVLATAASYPAPPNLFGVRLPVTTSISTVAARLCGAHHKRTRPLGGRESYGRAGSSA
jgi:hypothetical protein